MHELRGELGAMLMDSDFLAHAVPGRLVDAAANVAPNAIAATVRYEEKSYPFDNDRPPLRTMLGKLAIGPEAVGQLRLDGRFTEGIQSQLTAFNFAELEAYHRPLSETGIIELMGAVHKLSQRQEDGWLNDAYALVSEATRHPEQYTPPRDAPESLYMLCFAPYTTRRLTRRLVANNMIAAHMEQAIGPEPGADSQAMLAAFRQYFSADVVTDQHWTDLVQKHGFSQENATALALAGVDKINALASMQRLMREGKGTGVFERWQEVTAELSRVMAETDGESSLDVWRSIDIGHAFEGFRSYTLQDVLRVSTHKEFVNPPKTGGKAVILEDDLGQQRVWETVVRERTAYTTHDELCYAEPQGVTTHAADLDVGLFLLDIQNGEDATAGIQVAREVLWRRLDAIESGSLPPDAKKLKIVVWSTSNESVALASATMRKLLDDLPYAQRERISHSLRDGHGSSSRWGNPLDIEVRLKGWDDHSNFFWHPPR